MEPPALRRKPAEVQPIVRSDPGPLVADDFDKASSSEPSPSVSDKKLKHIFDEAAGLAAWSATDNNKEQVLDELADLEVATANSSDKTDPKAIVDRIRGVLE